MLNKDKEPAILDGEATLKIAPAVKTKAHVDPIAALWMPSQAKVHPYQVCVALAENAAENGVKIMLGCAVGDVLTGEDGIQGVVTEQGIIKTRYLINAAGIYGDDLAEMAGDRCFTIHNRRGTLVIIDKHK